ncbi:hypothetical protein MHU86_13606 [Fragilaria crotonensis]|nr:hypothetical protein MHU86_13606 [Fragilaria crotonensis]
MLPRHGYFASPSAWIFEQNGIIRSPPASKAAASDPDTLLSFDQAMADIEHETKWMEAAAKNVASLEKNGTWKKVTVLEAKNMILPGTWVLWCKHPQMEKSPNTKHTAVFVATLKKVNLKLMPQLLLGVLQFNCCLSCP